MMGDSKILKFIKSEAKNITVHDLLKKIHDDHQDNAEESAELKYSQMDRIWREGRTKPCSYQSSK